MEKNNVTRNLPEYWNEKARDILLKRKIVDVEYMGVEEARDYDWYSRPVCIVLDNGTRLILQADDEGNDGGALWYGTGKEQDVLPVLGLKD